MKKEGYYLNNFFCYLKNNRINFTVMNNYEGYPDFIPSDIDIAIDPKTFTKLDVLIFDFASNEQLNIVQKIWHGFQKCAYILCPAIMNSRFRLQLDFFVDFTAKGYLKLITSTEMISTSYSYKNFHIPSPPVELVFLITRRIIKNDANPDKISEIQQIINTNSDVLSEVKDIFGDNMREIVDSFVDQQHPNELKSNNPVFSSRLKQFAKNRSNIKYRITYRLSELKRLISRIRFPVGISVSLLSPDGGGKSTALKLVAPIISGAFHGSSQYYWRPGLLPPMGRLKFWNPSPEIDSNPTPHDHPSQNPIKSFFRFCYYSLDFIFGYYVKIKPQIIKKKIVYFDRYYFDFFVDLHRYKMSIPKFLPKLISILIPKPDVNIVLSCDPQIMLERKQELSATEISRQCDMYLELAKRNKSFHVVDASNDPKTIAKEISSIIISEKTKITKKSLNN
ncbi:hypothetical protein ACFL0S_04870 [Thermodesulfobacteriota bacterium]